MIYPGMLGGVGYLEPDQFKRDSELQKWMYLHQQQSQNNLLGLHGLQNAQTKFTEPEPNPVLLLLE